MTRVQGSTPTWYDAMSSALMLGSYLSPFLIAFCLCPLHVLIRCRLTCVADDVIASTTIVCPSMDSVLNDILLPASMDPTVQWSACDTCTTYLQTMSAHFFACINVNVSVVIAPVYAGSFRFNVERRVLDILFALHLYLDSGQTELYGEFGSRCLSRR